MNLRVPESWPARIAALFGAAILLLLVVTQLILPGIGEGAIEDRLTENGGVANVSLSATPAARLLWGDGDALRVDGSGLDLDVSTEEDPVVFSDLDRFDDVEIIIRDSSAGPVRLDNFVLARKGDESYSLEALGSTSAADLAEYAAEDFDVPGSGFIGGILNIVGVGADIGIDLDMRLDSDEGRVRVVEGGGEIGGVPTGPLAELITSAITLEL